MGIKYKEVIVSDENDEYITLQEETIEDDQEENDLSFIQGKNLNGDDNFGRQEFKEPIRRQLMLRAGLRCSNPDCRTLTIAFDPSLNKIISIGEAAHIIAAKPGGPRNPKDNPITENLRSIENGLWLCCNCHSMIDKKGSDKIYTVDLLGKWKDESESRYINQIIKPRIEMINALQEDAINDMNFDFASASNLQIALIMYCICNDTTFDMDKKTYGIDSESEGEDCFVSSYSDFHSWINNSVSRKFRIAMSLSNLPSLESPNFDFVRIKSIFKESLLADNMSKLVESDDREIQLSSNNVCKILFDDDEERIIKFIKQIEN